MVWFREEALEEMRDRIGQLGLRTCPICGSESIGLPRWPAVVHVGGHFERSDPQSPSVNILFMVMVECEMCGHTMFLNSERFHPGDVPTLERDSVT